MTHSQNGVHQVVEIRAIMALLEVATVNQQLEQRLEYRASLTRFMTPCMKPPKPPQTAASNRKALSWWVRPVLSVREYNFEVEAAVYLEERWNCAIA